MKLLVPLIAFLACAVDATRVHVRVHSHSKLYITPMGQQCAYNESIDPAMYPCQNHGVCVRLNATYGKCMTKFEAAKHELATLLQHAQDETADSEERDYDEEESYEEDDDEESEEYRLKKKSKFQKRRRKDPQHEEEEDLHDDEEESPDEDDVAEESEDNDDVDEDEEERQELEEVEVDDEEEDQAEVEEEEEEVDDARRRVHKKKQTAAKAKKLHLRGEDNESEEDSSEDEEEPDIWDLISYDDTDVYFDDEYEGDDFDAQPVDKSGLAECHLHCPHGQFCERGTNYCRLPTTKFSECFDTSAQVFVRECPSGSKCHNGSCQ